jgi:hypothetical protein
MSNEFLAVSALCWIGALSLDEPWFNTGVAFVAAMSLIYFVRKE